MAQPKADRPHPPARRVVVAVHAFGDLRPLIQEAARVAASLDADLAALLIEDENLQRMAALPFVHQVSLATARRLPMEAASLDREMAAFASLAAGMLADIAGRAGIRGTLESVRGQTAMVLRGAVSQGDLLMLAAGPAAGRSTRHLAASALAECWDCDLLLQKTEPARGDRNPRALVVCDDGTENAVRAVATAAALARADGRPLTIVDLDHHQVAIPTGARVRRIPSVDQGALTQLVRNEKAAMLILPATLSERFGGPALLEAAPCGVLIVR